MFETIVALATPPFKSALSVIRLSGDDCFFVVNKFFSKDLTKYTKNTIIHGEIKCGDEIIDDVVLLLYIAPHSFTGENSVEIISHGSPLIFNRIIEEAIKCGAKMAERGEYTQRAFLHNKMDLIQSESINDLINAESEESKNLSMMSLKGKTSTLIEPIKKDFIDLISNIEVNIDYPEYLDIEEVNSIKIKEIVEKNIVYIENLLQDGKKGKIIKDGINVAIVGKPNVGKSSILNKLIGEDKAIVTNIKGTTRDVVEGSFIYKGVKINLFDTAGIRDSNDFIESIGIEKSKKKILESDLVLMVYDSTSITEEDEEVSALLKNKNVVYIYNKKDLLTNLDGKKYYFSATNDNINSLKDKIFETLGLTLQNFKNPSINNAREIGILENIDFELKEIQKDYDLPIDLMASKLKDVLNKILSLTGEDCDFDMVKEIFSRFCVGK